MSQPFDLPHDNAHEIDFYIVQHARRNNHQIKRLVQGNGLNAKLNYMCKSAVQEDGVLKSCPGFLEVKYTNSDLKWHITKKVNHGNHVQPAATNLDAQQIPTADAAEPGMAQSTKTDNFTTNSPVSTNMETLKDSTKVTIHIRSTEPYFETGSGARLIQTQAIIPLIEANRGLFPSSFNIHAVVTASNGSKRDLDIIATSATVIGANAGQSQSITVSAAVSRHKTSTESQITPPSNADVTPEKHSRDPTASMMTPISMPSTPLQHSAQRSAPYPSMLDRSEARQAPSASPSPAGGSNKGPGPNRYANTRCSACHEYGHRLGSRDCTQSKSKQRTDLTEFGDGFKARPKATQCSMCGGSDHSARSCTKALQLDKFTEI